MDKVKKHILEMNFPRFFRRFFIAALAILFLGGAAIGVTFRTEISEIFTRLQSAESAESGVLSPEGNPPDRSAHMEAEYGKFKVQVHRDLLKDFILTGSSTGFKIALAAFVIFCFAAAAIYWLGVAAWLYQESEKTGFHSLFWLFLGLAGNLLAVLFFVLVRSVISVRCPGCGSWQPRKNQYCTGCGAAVCNACSSCGKIYRTGISYCSACGKKLPHDPA